MEKSALETSLHSKGHQHIQDLSTGASQAPMSWDSPGKNTGVGCHALLQEIFPTQGSNLGLSHCRQILYHLSHQGSLINTLLVFNFRI